VIDGGLFGVLVVSLVIGFVVLWFFLFFMFSVYALFVCKGECCG